MAEMSSTDQTLGEGFAPAEETTAAAEETEPTTKSEPIKRKRSFRLFVGRLPEDITDEEFNAYWEPLGGKPDFLKKNTANPFGFVIVQTQEEFDAILAAEHKIKDKLVNVKPPKMQQQRYYIGDLEESTTGDHLKEYFEQFGKVVDAHTVPGRGFGFVTIEADPRAPEIKSILEESHDINGKVAKVQAAKPRAPRGGPMGMRGGFRGGYAPWARGGYGGGYGGYRGGYGGGWRGGYGGYAPY